MDLEERYQFFKKNGQHYYAALTGHVERADKISASLSENIRVGVQDLRLGKIAVYQTPVIYKERDGIAESYIKVQKNHGAGTWILTRIVINPGKSPQEYNSVIKPTATKSAEERIEMEIRKRITKKLRDAWSETPAGAQGVSTTTLKQVCKLHKWEKHSHKMPMPCIVQPKIDGVRCYWDGTEHKLFSRSGKEYVMPEITEILKRYFDGIDLDGELAYSDWNIPMPEVVHGVAHQYSDIIFHVFDRPDENHSFTDRFIANLPKWVAWDYEGRVTFVKTRIAENKSEVEEFHKSVTAIGMEGTIVRDPEGSYKYGKRVYDILKFKQEWEEDMLITKMKADPHPQGDMAIFECKHEGTGAYVDVVPAWTHDDRRAILSNSPVGKKMKVEYRAISKDGVPIHAVGRTTFKKLVNQ